MASNTVPTPILRDILLIWLYVTVTSMETIQGGSVSPADIMNQLTGSIDTSAQANKQALETICAAVSNNAAFGTVKQSLMSIDVLSVNWGGGGPHPRLTELNSVFIQNS